MDNFNSLSLYTRIAIIDDNDRNASIGGGVIALLNGIKEYGSLNKAAKKLHMAYSKAWKIVKGAEERFGFMLIVRDGARGSTLTKEGMQLLDIYGRLETEVREFANKRFSEELEKLK